MSLESKKVWPGDLVVLRDLATFRGEHKSDVGLVVEARDEGTQVMVPVVVLWAGTLRASRFWDHELDVIGRELT